MLEELARHHKSCHTTFQCDSFITGLEGVTLWGCFRQAMRELFSRISVCRADAVAIAEMELDLEELDDDDSLSEKRKEVRRLDMEWKLPLMRKKAEDRLGELATFYAQAVGCYDELTKTEDLSPLRTQILEYDYWEKRYVLEAALRRAVGQPASTDLYRHALALPAEHKQRVIKAMLNGSQLLQIAQNHSPIVPPKAEVPTIADARRLIGGPALDQRLIGAS